MEQKYNIENMINENKQRHMFGVAQFMYNEAPKYGLSSEDMFVLGLLHDIGYIKGGWQRHEEYGENLMKQLGFKYAKEIGEHNAIVDKGLSKASLLLLAADSVVDMYGNVGTYESRRKDIETRYDISDRNYYLDRFDKRIEMLKANGFNY